VASNVRELQALMKPPLPVDEQKAMRDNTGVHGERKIICGSEPRANPGDRMHSYRTESIA